jgi:hypothetical protein
MPDGRGGIEGQRPGTAAHGQRAGHDDTLTRQPDTVRGEGDVQTSSRTCDVTGPRSVASKHGPDD